MIFDLSKIEFSKNDIKRGIKLPSELDENLAHFLGIHIGDGHLGNKNNDYRIEYTGHQINELAWYNDYLSKLIFKLFNKKVNPRISDETVRITVRSKAIIMFLSKLCDVPIGPKTNCDIPHIIKNSNVTIKKAFIRGLADTDFSLIFKKMKRNINYYPVIDYQTSNKILRDSVMDLLKSFGFSIHSGERMKKRKDKRSKSYYFQINGVRALNKWMDEIGFTSHNQLTKLEVWKKQGFLPPKTNINDRINILKKMSFK